MGHFVVQINEFLAQGLEQRINRRPDNPKDNDDPDNPFQEIGSPTVFQHFCLLSRSRFGQVISRFQLIVRQVPQSPIQRK